MRSIFPLPPELRSKIAAGEVVERPASVVKELIENALDAGATQIDIVLEAAGTKRITVRDNGQGMSAEDVAVCFEAYSTSKITTAEDLFRIKTFGFRGEALPSIAAVSRMHIQSRRALDAFGTQIEIVAGTKQHIQSIGMAAGTVIHVESLFFSTPARQKFLKDTRTELRYIRELVAEFALVHATVGFSVQNDQKRIFDLPANQTISERIQLLLGETIANELIPLSAESEYGTLTGFLGTPQIATTNSTHQYAFVNNRGINPGILSKAATTALGSILEARAQPIFLLYVTLPYESVDVNVHPRKLDVAFVYPEEIQSLVDSAVKNALQKYDIGYRKATDGRTHSTYDKRMHTDLALLIRDGASPWQPESKNNEQKPDNILQFKNVYLVTTGTRGVLLFDQHAAHERILFEQFEDAFKNLKQIGTSTQLDTPIIFDMPIVDLALIQEQAALLDQIGFTLEPFGGNAVRLSAVPEYVLGRKYQNFIQELLGEMRSTTNGDMKLDRISERTIAFLACRSAVKAGDPLSNDERSNLIIQLFTCRNPYTCPHGRPTHVEITKSELDRMFKRT